MDVKSIFLEDLQIAQAIIRKDETVTRNYFYKHCYPLFKSIYDNYYTDCINCKEFIDEIYVILLTPSKTTGKCQMENFKGESTLASWLKTSCLYFCYKKYKAKKQMPLFEPLPSNHSQDNDEDVNKDELKITITRAKDARILTVSDNGIGMNKDELKFGHLQIDFNNLNREDAMAILKRMPNKRYSEIIRLRYLEMLTNEETAIALGMTMQNFYNKHKLAKAQYIRIHGKEEWL